MNEEQLKQLFAAFQGGQHVGVGPFEQAAQQQNQMFDQLRQQGVFGGIRNSSRNVGGADNPGLDYLRSPEERQANIASRQGNFVNPAEQAANGAAAVAQQQLLRGDTQQERLGLAQPMQGPPSQSVPARSTFPDDSLVPRDVLQDPVNTAIPTAPDFFASIEQAGQQRQQDQAQAERDQLPLFDPARYGVTYPEGAPAPTGQTPPPPATVDAFTQMAQQPTAQEPTTSPASSNPFDPRNVAQNVADLPGARTAKDIWQGNQTIDQIPGGDLGLFAAQSQLPLARGIEAGADLRNNVLDLAAQSQQPALELLRLIFNNF